MMTLRIRTNETRTVRVYVFFLQNEKKKNTRSVCSRSNFLVQRICRSVWYDKTESQNTPYMYIVHCTESAAFVSLFEEFACIRLCVILLNCFCYSNLPHSRIEAIHFFPSFYVFLIRFVSSCVFARTCVYMIVANRIIRIRPSNSIAIEGICQSSILESQRVRTIYMYISSRNITNVAKILQYILYKAYKP